MSAPEAHRLQDYLTRSAERHQIFAAKALAAASYAIAAIAITGVVAHFGKVAHGGVKLGESVKLVPSKGALTWTS